MVVFCVNLCGEVFDGIFVCLLVIDMDVKVVIFIMENFMKVMIV